MAKRFECPRCGSGVRPADIQCFRCGELLQEEAPQPKGPEPAQALPEVKAEPVPQPAAKRAVQHLGTPKAHVTPTIRSSGAIKHVPSETMPVEKERQLERKEKELAEKEKVIAGSLEQLESDTRALEEALKRYEHEDTLVHERERMLKEREDALESLAMRMEQTLQQTGGSGDDPGALVQDAQRIKQVSEEYSKRIAEGRRLQRQQLDREIEERMERLRTLQQLINVASNMSSTIPASEVEAKDAEEIIRKEQEQKFDPVVVNRALEQLEREMRTQASKEEKLQFELISTHDERLDSILGGGIPAGHVVIVNGSPGSMKSTLCYYIMHNAVTKSGKRGMYFSLEQKRDSIVRQMERMGMSRAEAEDRMMVVDMVDLRKAMKGEKGDWRQILMRYVKNVHMEMPFELFVLDSLESFKSLAMFDFSRQHMMDLFDWFKSLNITVMAIAEKPLEALECSKQGETYLADGVIELLMKEFDGAKVYRWLRCLKMRGMQNDPRYYAFYHTGQEFKFSLPLVDSGG